MNILKSTQLYAMEPRQLINTNRVGLISTVMQPVSPLETSHFQKIIVGTNRGYMVSLTPVEAITPEAIVAATRKKPYQKQQSKKDLIGDAASDARPRYFKLYSDPNAAVTDISAVYSGASKMSTKVITSVFGVRVLKDHLAVELKGSNLAI